MDSNEKWVEKYRPKTLGEVVGNKKPKKELRKWAKRWKKGEPKNKAVRLVGPPGIGKTTSAYALASEQNWEVMELNASDKRTKDIINKLVGAGSKSGTLGAGTTGKRLVIIDEADNLHGTSDRGGKAAITKILKQTNQPIVLIANDEYGMSRGMRNNSKKLKFKNPNQSEVIRALQKIAKKEGIQAYKNALREIARNADGDVRGAINDLQSIIEELRTIGKEKLRKKDVNNLGRRDREENIWKLLNEVFRKNNLNSLRNVKRDLDSDITPDELLHWIDDNLPKKYEGKNLHGPLKKLAESSIYLARTNTTGNYSFWSYASELMTYGVMIEKPFKSAPLYNGPQIYRRLSQSKKDQEKLETVSRKIADTYFFSEQKAKEIIPYLKEIFSNDIKESTEIARELRLDLEEIQYLGGDEEILQKAEKKPQKEEERENKDQEQNQISLGDF